MFGTENYEEVKPTSKFKQQVITALHLEKKYITRKC